MLTEPHSLLSLVIYSVPHFQCPFYLLDYSKIVLHNTCLGNGNTSTYAKNETYSLQSSLNELGGGNKVDINCTFGCINHFYYLIILFIIFLEFHDRHLCLNGKGDPFQIITIDFSTNNTSFIDSITRFLSNYRYSRAS